MKKFHTLTITLPSVKNCRKAHAIKLYFQTNLPRQHFIHCRKRVDFGAVEHGQRAVFFIHNQADFGAA
jgi:hypothetical protein